MKADDEGFIANVQIILIVSKTKKSDLNNLIKNGFIIDLGDVSLSGTGMQITE